MWFIMIIAFLIISYFDTKTLRIEKNYIHLTIYIVLMSVSCVLGILAETSIKIPSPADFIKSIIFMIMGK